MRDIKDAARFSQHAADRFAERFPGKDAIESWKRAEYWSEKGGQYQFLDSKIDAMWVVGRTKDGKLVIVTVY